MGYLCGQHVESKGDEGKSVVILDITLPLFVSNRDRDYFYVTLFTHHLLDGDDIEWLKQFKDYGLSNDEAKALVVLRKAGSINNFIYRVTNDVDTLTASQHLRRLRDAGLLGQQGKGSATCYTLASATVTIPTNTSPAGLLTKGNASTGTG